MKQYQNPVSNTKPRTTDSSSGQGCLPTPLSGDVYDIATSYGNTAALARMDEETRQASGEEAQAEEGEVPRAIGGLCTRFGFVEKVLDAMGELPGFISRIFTPYAVAVGRAAVEHDLLIGTADATAETLRLADPVNRAEATKILVEAFGLPKLSSNEVKRSFSDVPITQWYAEYVYGAASVGVAQGYGDDTFNPSGNLEYDYLEGFVGRAVSPPGVTDPEAFDPTVEPLERSILGEKADPNLTSYLAYSLDTAEMPTRDPSASPEERTEAAVAIADTLDAENSARYQPVYEGEDLVKTFCNVFAHDYVTLMGAFLPRVWWTEDVLNSAQGGEAYPDPVYGETVREMSANKLYDWLEEWGPKYGWSKLGTTDNAGLTAAQEAANQGLVVVISASTGMNEYSGHITAVVPETPDNGAVWNESHDEVLQPVESQAGAANETRGAGGTDWWNKYGKINGVAYPGGKAIWVHG